MIHCGQVHLPVEEDCAGLAGLTLPCALAEETLLALGTGS